MHIFIRIFVFSSTNPFLWIRLHDNQPCFLRECGGEPSLQQWIFNEPMSGFFHNNATNMCINVDNCQTEVIYDGCTTTGFFSNAAHFLSYFDASFDFFSHSLPAFFFFLTGSTCAGQHLYLNQQWTLTADHRIQTQLPTHGCLTVASDDTLDVEPCITPLPYNQTFYYSTVTQQITTSDQLCVTAPSAGPNTTNTLVVGKALSDASWAVVFLNNDVVYRNVTCDLDCFLAMG
jgi:hypothetical protein